MASASSIIGQWFRWQNRRDGAYVFPLPGAKQATRSLIEDEFRILGVLNADFDLLMKGLSSPPEQWAMVGPPLRFQSPGRAFDLRTTPMSVVLTIDWNVLESQARVLSVDEIEAELAAKGVKFGIDREAIARACSYEGLRAPETVATGKPAAAGAPARFDLRVQLGDRRALLAPDGLKVNFKELGKIPEVAEGTAIYEKIPATSGEPGQDVFGNLLPATAGRDINMAPPENTRIRPGAGLIYEASCDGYLYAKNGVIAVGRVFEVPGDLDLSFGNIEYHGDVTIRGSVPADFIVKAGGALRVLGSVASAQLESSSGSIEVKGSVFGSKLTAAGDIACDFAHNSEFQCGGTLLVAKYLQFCQGLCHDLRIKARDGFIHGGAVLVRHSAEVGVLGTDAGTSSSLRLADPSEEKAQHRLIQVREERAELDKNVSALEMRVVQLKQRMKAGGELRGQAKEDGIKLIQNYQALLDKRKELATLEEECLAVLNAPRDRTGYLEVRSRINQGAYLSLFGKSVPVEDHVAPVRFSFTDGAYHKT